MSFIWVQQWVALPVIPEGQMGDSNPNHAVRPSDYDGHSFEDRQQPAAGGAMPDGAAFQSQYGGVSQQQRGDQSRQTPGLAPYNVGSQQAHGGPFNLGSMSSALPDYGQQQSGGRIQPGGSSGLRGPQYSSMSPLGGQHSMGQYPGAGMDPSLDVTHLQQAQRLGHATGGANPYLSYGQPMAQYYYPTAQYGAPGQQPYYTGGAQNVMAYGRRTSAGAGQAIPPDYMGNFAGQGLGRPVASLSGYGDAYAPSDGEFDGCFSTTVTTLTVKIQLHSKGPPLLVAA